MNQGYSPVSKAYLSFARTSYTIYEIKKTGRTVARRGGRKGGLC